MRVLLSLLCNICILDTLHTDARDLDDVLPGFSKFTVYAPLVSALEKRYRSQSSKKHQEDLRELNAFGKQVEQMLAQDGLLVLPAQWTTAPFHHGVGTAHTYIHTYIHKYIDTYSAIQTDQPIDPTRNPERDKQTDRDTGRQEGR